MLTLPEGFKLHTWPDPESVPPFYIVSFFTSGKGGRGYEEEVAPFLSCIDELGYHDRTVILDAGPTETWRSATMLKARVCEWAYQTLPASVLWLDIDARIRGPLTLFEKWDEWRSDSVKTIEPPDIGVRFRPVAKRQFTCSGTVFLRQGSGWVGQMLGRWRIGCEQAAQGEGVYGGVEGDQDVLGMVLQGQGNQNPYALKIHDLPPEYCFIFDIDVKRCPGVEPVIEHMQASRKRKGRQK